MQEPTDVVVRNQRRELACDRQLDLTSVLAQLRFDVGEVEGRVDLGLRLTCNELAVPEKSVLIQLQAKLASPALEPVRMQLGACCEQQGDAVAGPISEPELHLIVEGEGADLGSLRDLGDERQVRHELAT